MTSFSGLCVGGPCAGRLIVGTTGTIHVEERLKRRLGRVGGKVASVGAEFKTHRYYSHQVGEVGLWVHESMTLDQGVAEIAAGYIEACKQADPRVVPSFSR